MSLPPRVYLHPPPPASHHSTAAEKATVTDAIGSLFSLGSLTPLRDAVQSASPPSTCCCCCCCSASLYNSRLQLLSNGSRYGSSRTTPPMGGCMAELLIAMASFAARFCNVQDGVVQPRRRFMLIAMRCLRCPQRCGTIPEGSATLHEPGAGQCESLAFGADFFSEAAAHTRTAAGLPESTYHAATGVGAEHGCTLPRRSHARPVP
jgi:hypothetical protein